jgi:hypothetical protein
VADPLRSILLLAPQADPDTLVRLRAAGVQVVTEMPATVPDYVVVPDTVSTTDLARILAVHAPAVTPTDEPDPIDWPTLGRPTRRSFGPRELAVKGAAARRRERG